MRSLLLVPFEVTKLFLDQKTMKQLSIMTDDNQHDATDRATHAVVPINQWQLFVDGASRNNPGPSGGGFCIFKNNEMVHQNGFFLGIKTNNQAEYLALLLGIFFLEPLQEAKDNVAIFADSELLVRQLNGIYKVKEPQLRQLHACAHQQLHELRATLSHVLRDKNKQADKMANLGIDSKIAPPDAFLQKLSLYALSL